MAGLETEAARRTFGPAGEDKGRMGSTTQPRAGGGGEENKEKHMGAQTRRKIARQIKQPHSQKQRKSQRI